MANQDDVRRLALALPGTTEETGKFHFKVQGKLFAWAYLERVEPKKPRVPRDDVIALRVANEWDKEALLAIDSDTFFTTPHYDGYPAVLVRLDKVEVVELEELLLNAWKARAPRALRTAYEAGHAG